MFEPEYGKIALEDMLFEAGTRIVYDSTLIYAETEDSNIVLLGKNSSLK